METMTAAEYRAMFAQPKKNKFFAIKVYDDGHCFDSKTEYRRYLTLKQEQTLGLISFLNVHPKFELHVQGQSIGFYTGDFEYTRNGVYVLEDVKSPATRKTKDYRLRKKLVLACHGITITEYMP